MALSAAARAALEQFKTQQGNAQVSIPDEVQVPLENRLNDREDPIHTQTSIYAPKPESTNWNRINDPSTTIAMGGLFRPEQPKTFKDSGISYRVLEGLILKIIKQEGPQNEGQLADVMKVSVNVFRDILISLNKRELLDTPMPLHYDLTTKGRDLVAMVEREDAYIGPAPVPFAEYVEMVKQQAKRERRA